MGSLSTTWKRTYRQPFAPLIPGVCHVPFNNVQRLKEAITPDTAAVLVEVIQGEGGVHPAESGYLAEVQAACNANGTLLIIDEVQTGFGRTGSLFAYQAEGIQPDIVCLAKSIAGGLPMGATLLAEGVGRLPPGSHGSTFGGHPMMVAAAQAVLNVLTSTDLIERTAQRGEAIIARLRQTLPPQVVREVRGRGLMLGIELRGKATPYLSTLQAHGVLALTAGLTTLRLLPPLVITDDQLETVLATLEEVLNHAA
jgi:acetylornithine/LysW-gamma-L-lysine aminotransferase